MKKYKLSLIIAFFGLFSAGNTFADAATPTPHDPVSFELFDNRIFIEVFLDGEGPFKFIFDTGGNNSMTFDLAKKLHLPVTDAGQGGGLGNGSQAIGATKVKKFRVGNIEISDQDFLVIDYSKIQKAFNIKALDGIFGYELLQNYLAYVDYGHSQISFFSNVKDFDMSGFEKLSFDLQYNKPFVTTKINGINAYTLIDTGDRSALSVSKRFRKNQPIDRYFLHKHPVVSGYGIGGPIPAQIAVLKTLDLTKTSKISQVVTRAPTTPKGLNAIPGLDASIGNEVLKQFNVGFDYRNKSIYFKKNQNFGQSTKFTPVPNPDFDSVAETKNFTIYWSKADTETNEVDRLALEAERIYKKLQAILRTKQPSSEKLTLTLNGDGKKPNQQMLTPHTDPSTGWVYLYRYPNADFAYQNGLSHEVSHAYRFDHIKKHEADRATGFGFLEEGLAEYLSTLIEPKKPGFSTYGKPLTVTAGYWLVENKVIPLEKLLTQFDDLDQKCMLQSYAERSSFIEFLDKTFGRKKLLEISYIDQPISAKIFDDIYGSDFSSLTRRWQIWLRQQVNQTKDFKIQSSEYKASYMQRGMYVCEPEEELISEN